MNILMSDDDPIALMSGYSTPETVARGMRADTDQFISKLSMGMSFWQ